MYRPKEKKPRRYDQGREGGGARSLHQKKKGGVVYEKLHLNNFVGRSLATVQKKGQQFAAEDLNLGEGGWRKTGHWSFGRNIA